MSEKTQRLGLDETIDVLRKLLVDKYRIAKSVEEINVDDPFLAAGIGLTSIDTVEMLGYLEEQFDVEFRNLEDWIDDPPSLRELALFLVDKSRQ